MKSIIVLLASVCAAAAVAADRTELRRWYEAGAHYDAVRARARQVAPRRRDAPARELNVSDEEVREIQVAALEVVPRAIVNIGAVTTGCACEEGPGCTDQVWIVATDAVRAKGLQLSRVEQRWRIGPVQAWWLRYDALLARRAQFQGWREFENAERKLLDEFPACASPPSRLASH